jgi:outer membrane lipase/esterase
MKTNKRRILPALVASLLAAAAPAANAQQYSQIVVFGDSLSDVGYYRPVLTALGVPASLVPILGRFTTSPGPIFAEVIARDYGLGTLNPSNVSGGTDFAQGGARVAANSASTPPGATQRPITTQVTEFLGRSNGVADSRALYSIWGGANDVLQILAGASSGAIPPDQVSPQVQAAAAAEVAQIARLRAAGARNIIVFGLPNIGATPGLIASGATAAGTATALSSGYNTALFSGIAQSGLRVLTIDSFAFLADIRANPALFGISNITVPACRAFPPFSSAPDALFCPPSALIQPNAATTFAFADGIHPTTISHQLIADFVEGMLTGPAQYSMLAEAPINARANHIRAIAEGLATSREDEVGKWNVFITGATANYDIDPTTGYPALKSRSNNLGVGVGVRASEAVTVGAAWGRDNIKANFNGNFGAVPENPGGFNAAEDVFSVFIAARWKGFYGNAILSIGDLRYNNVQRNVYLGPAVRTSDTKTKGSNASVAVNAGYDFAIGPVLVGPTAGVVSQNVEVNGFDEINMGSSNLRMDSQQRKSEIWSVGLRVSGRLGAWEPWLKFTADKERKDDVRIVSARPISIMDGSIPFDTIAYSPDNSFTVGSIGVRGNFEHWGVSFAAYKVSGRSGSQDDGIAGMLSYKF